MRCRSWHDFHGFVPGINDIIQGGYTNAQGEVEPSLQQKIQMGQTAITALNAYRKLKEQAKGKPSEAQTAQLKAYADAINANMEYFGYGFGFVGLTLFMMQQVAPGPHQMAHYAFASGIMNLSVMLTGMASGFLSDALGYRWFFLAVMLATVPAFLMTWFVPFTYEDQAKKETK